MSTKPKTPSTYYVKCATQAERDALLDYAVGRGAVDIGGCEHTIPESYPFYPNARMDHRGVWCSSSIGDIELTPDGFRRKVRKLWPKETATSKPRKVKPRNPSQLDRIEKSIAGLSERIDAQRMERYALDHAQLDRIEATLSLIRAEATAREQGLVPVVPEPWRPKVNGLAKYGGVVSKVTDHSTSVGEWWFIDGRWVPTHKISEPSPAEVAAHQAEIAAKEEAARVPAFGSRVEYQGKEYRVVSDAEVFPGHWAIISPTAWVTFAKRHEFKILP